MSIVSGGTSAQRLGNVCNGSLYSELVSFLGEEKRASCCTPPPLAQARPRSQKSGQNGGSTPTPCLDKAVHARDTCDSQTGNNIVSHD